MPDELIVESPAAARVVLDPVLRASLEPFIGVEQTAQGAAREAGVPLSTMTSRVRRFVQLGLLARTGAARRQGRPMPLYRAPASIYVPFSATDLTSDRLLSTAAFAAMQRRLTQSIGAAWVHAARTREQSLGLHVYWHPELGVTQNITPRPTPGGDLNAFFWDLLGAEQPAVWDTWGVLHLDPQSAKRLQRELADLKERYHAQATGPLRPYIVRLAVAPLHPDEIADG